MPSYSKEIQLRKYNIKELGKTEAVQQENELQKQCEELLKRLDVPYIRIPETITRLASYNSPIPIGIKRIISEYFKGLPDLIIFRKDNNSYNTALFVELKSKKGKLSNAQLDWSERLNVHVCYSFEAFVDLLNQFILSDGNDK